MTDISEKSADSNPTLKRKKKKSNKKEKANKKLKLNSKSEVPENLHKLHNDGTDAKMPDRNADPVSQPSQKKAKNLKKKKKLENMENRQQTQKPDSNSDSKLNEKETPKKKKKLNNEKQPEQNPDSDSDSELNETNKEKTPKKKKTLQSYDNFMTPDERQLTIFVNNLPLSVTKKDIAKIFTQCGQVESVRIRSAIPKEGNKLKKIAVIKREYSEGNKNNLNAYVKFVKKSDVEKALKINGVLFGGHRLQVDKCQENLRYDNKLSIFIGNLTFNAKEDDIFAHFADCGEIERVRLIRDKITGVGKGIGFVVFKDPGSVELALKLNGENFDNRPLRISHVIKKIKHSKKRNFNKKFKNMKNDKKESRDQKINKSGDKQKTEESRDKKPKKSRDEQKNKSRDEKVGKKTKKMKKLTKVGKMPKTFMT